MARLRHAMLYVHRLAKGLGACIAVVIAVVALLPLLPLILPGVALSEALEERRLSRFRCSACGNAIGRAEIRRAKQAAPRPATAAGEPFTRLNRHFLVQWQVICPACGQKYVYRPNERRAELIPEHRTLPATTAQPAPRSARRAPLSTKG